MKDIKKVLEGVYDNIELRRTIVPLFIGNPGISKSVQIRAFAKEKGVKLIPFITSQRNPFEISGLAMPDKDTKRMSFWDFDTLLELQDGDILFFDEVFNGNPTTLNACLTILEEREMISGKKLPDIMIVAAANPQGMVPLTPQIKERFVWYKMEFPKESWEDYIFNKYKMPKEVSRKLSNIVSGEDFKRDKNYLSSRSIDKAIGMIIKGVPTPYEDELLPILNTLIENKLKESFEYGKGKVLEVGEKIPWLDLIRENDNIEITESANDEVVESESANEILILNDKDEIIGEVKDIEMLKLMYYFSDSDIKDIEEGIKTIRLDSPATFFFKKQIK